MPGNGSNKENDSIFKIDLKFLAVLSEGTSIVETCTFLVTMPGLLIIIE